MVGKVGGGQTCSVVVLIGSGQSVVVRFGLGKIGVGMGLLGSV